MDSYPSQIVTFKGACTGSPTAANTVTGLRILYDGSSTVGTGLVEGDATTLQKLDRYTSGVAVYATVGTSTFDDYGRALTSTDGLNATTTTALTPATGALPTSIQTTNPVGWTTTTSLDPARTQPLSTTDVNGRVTATTYDPLGRLTGVWLPGRSQATQSASLTYTYSVPGGAAPRVPVTVTSNTLRDDGVTYIPNVKIYDGLLRQRQEQADPANNAVGRVITDTFYDTHGWVVKTNNPYFNDDVATPSTSYWVAPDNKVPGQVGTLYDGMGRATATTYSSLAIEQWRTTTTYPGLDRTDVTPPSGGTAKTALTDSRGHAIAAWNYDTATPTGVAADAKITTYTYDAGDHLTGINDAAGNAWSYGFDVRGRQTSSTDPDMGTSAITYDNRDQVTTTTSPSGTLASSYDTLGRMTGSYVTSTTGTRLSSWTYDGITTAKGYLSSSSRFVGGNEYKRSISGYSTRYQPTGSTVTIPASEGGLAGSYATTTAYTPDSELVDSISYPAAGGLPAETMYYSYNVNGPLSSAGGLDYYQADIHTTPFGEVDRLTLGPNPKQVQTTNVFDEGTRRLLSTHLDKQTGTTSAVSSYTYTYNAAGDLTSATDVRDASGGGGTDRQCYTYDRQHRLAEAWTDTAGVTTAGAPKVPGLGGCTDTTPSAGTGGSVGGPAPYWLTWSFDTVGNRSQQVNHSTTTATGGTTTSYTHPGSGTAQPHTTTGTTATGTTPGSAAYGYNTSGQLTSRPGAGGGSQSLAYTPDGRLDTLVQSGGAAAGTTTYIYDADGTQLLRRSPGHTTLYLGYEDLDLTTTGTLTANRYYPGPGSTVTRTKVSTATGNGNLAYQFATDGHNSNTVTLAAGTLTTTRRDQTPYGTPRGTSPPTWAGTKGFVGGTTDTTTLTLLGARNYDATLGAFTTPDPLLVPTDPGSLTGYGYANNNPVSNSDPTGLLTDDGWGSGGSGPAKEHNHSRNQGNEASTGNVTGAGGGGAGSKSVRALTGPDIEPPRKRHGSPPPTDVYSHPDALLKAFSCQGTVCAYTYPEYVPGYDEQQQANQEAADLGLALIGYTDAKECVHGGALACGSLAVGVLPLGKVFKALRVAVKASRITKAAKTEVPTVVFSRNRAPGIAGTFDDAVANGAPTQLNRVGEKARDANRRAALRGQSPAPAGQSLDEYPFACSAQGGCGATVRSVPVGEQSYQGGVISRFFQDNGIGVGDPFNVMFGP